MKFTKDEKLGAVLALVMAGLLAAMIPRTRGGSLQFALAFPALIYSLHFWLGRARSASMADAADEDIAVFKRQPALRLMFLLFAIGLAVLTWVVVSDIYQDSLYRHYSVGDAVFCYSASVLFLGGPCLLLLWGAGPYEVRLDLRRRRYAFTQGLPLLPLTKHGPTDGSDLYVLRMRYGQHQLRFRPPGNRWGYLLDIHGGEASAQAQAQDLAGALGLRVECGDQPS